MIKDTLLKQFNACYDENHWFVCLKNAIADVTGEQAAWVPPGGDNSIIGLLSHLNYYNNAYLQRFKGLEFEYTINDNDETFAKGQTSPDEAWTNEAANFESIMSEWVSLLESADEAKFDELVPPKNEATWASLLAHINIHNAHHGGQIVILRKLQGSWDTGKGVS